jgi:predicted RNA-binding protein with PIN domain
MPYIIDGHNLIPKLGLRLDSFDDEIDLITRLQEFCRVRRAKVEVYFDGAPPGQSGTRSAGAVTAHFVRQGSSADSAIEVRLETMGRSAKNWTVVSSDHRVRRAAQSVHASVITSDEFARQVSAAQNERMTRSKGEASLSPDEVEEWLNVFKKRD